MSNNIITHIEALEKARSYCAYQERSQQEVIKKLKSFKLNEDELNYVLLQLIQGDFLNEERFARAYVSGKIRMKKWGRRKIKHHLKTKGLTDNCIALGMQEIEDDEYYETLQHLLSYKWRMVKETNHYKKKQKVISYLYGKGFESDLIREAMEEMTD